jgi:hypothetical protein
MIVARQFTGAEKRVRVYTKHIMTVCCIDATQVGALPNRSAPDHPVILRTRHRPAGLKV